MFSFFFIKSELYEGGRCRFRTLMQFINSNRLIMSILNLIFCVCYLKLKQNQMRYRESIVITSVKLRNSTEGTRFTVCDSESWPQRGISRYHANINDELLFISHYFIRKRWLTPSLKIHIPYFNSDCTIKYIIEKRKK